MKINFQYNFKRNKHLFLYTSHPYRAIGVLEIKIRGRLKIVFRRPLILHAV